MDLAQGLPAIASRRRVPIHFLLGLLRIPFYPRLTKMKRNSLALKEVLPTDGIVLFLKGRDDIHTFKRT